MTGRQDDAFEAARPGEASRKLPAGLECSCSRRVGPEVAQRPCKDTMGLG